MTTDDLISAASESLSRLGLRLVGTSGKSRSSYWALSDGESDLRLRLSDHGVVYGASDCAVCLGTAIDDDVRLDLAQDVETAVRKAVSMLVAAQIAENREAAESSPVTSPDEEEAEIRKAWGHLL